MAESNKIKDLASTFIKGGPTGVIVALIFLLGFFYYLGYKKDANHIEHWTESTNKMIQAYERQADATLEDAKATEALKTFLEAKL